MFNFIKKRIRRAADFIFNETLFAVTTALVLFALTFLPAPAKADVVTDWSEIANTIIVKNEQRPPAVALVEMAYVHGAIYEAVNAIDRHYTPYAVSPKVAPSPNTSKEAAAATAAYKVLLALFPAQELHLTSQYKNCLYLIAEGDAKAQGITLGQEIAEKFLAFRAGDGRNGEVTFWQGSGPGAWRPTMPAFTAPLTPLVRKNASFYDCRKFTISGARPAIIKKQTMERRFSGNKNFGVRREPSQNGAANRDGTLLCRTCRNAMQSYFPPTGPGEKFKCER